MPDPRSGPRPRLSSDDMEALRRWQQAQDRKLQPTPDMVNGPHVILHTPGTVNSGSATITVPFDLPDALPIYMQRNTASQWTWLVSGIVNLTGTADIGLTDNTIEPNIKVVGQGSFLVAPSEKLYADLGDHIVVTWDLQVRFSAGDTCEAEILVSESTITAATLLSVELIVGRLFQ